MLGIILLKAALFMLSVTGGAKCTPTGESLTNTKEEFTSDFAREVIRRAKAADVKAMLDLTQDPCTNFYEYACGNWRRHHPAQLLNDLMTDNFRMIGKAFDRTLQKKLKGETSTVSLEAKVQYFYQSCLLVHRDDAHYKLTLRSAYKDFGELPMLIGQNWNESIFNWWALSAGIQTKYGVQVLIAVDVINDIKNDSRNALALGPAKLSKDNAKDELSLALDLEHFLGMDNLAAKATVKELLAFEGELKEGFNNHRKSNSQYLLIPKTVEELQAELADFIDLRTFLATIFGDAALPEIVYVADLEYLKMSLRIVSKTPKRILANYILWQFIREYVIDSDATSIPSWCLERTKRYFGKYIEHMAYNAYRSEKTEADVQSIWMEVRNVFAGYLGGDRYDWITRETRAKAITKLEKMELLINSFDNVDFEALYGNVKINPVDYVHNVQQITAHVNAARLKRLNEPAPAHYEDHTGTLTLTPSYDTQRNHIRIPVAFLQPRFFWDDCYPQAFKYATLGAQIAREMLHGFDADGQQYDEYANRNTWWDNRSAYEFGERRKCFQAQYHNFRYGGVRLHGNIPQSEYIADNGAIKLAYAAYNRWLQRQKEIDAQVEQRETLPDVHLTNRQLFFTANAQMWCDDVQALLQNSIATTDTHAPNMYRVNGPLSNFQEFSWIYQCKPDAPMDPEFKCAIY